MIIVKLYGLKHSGSHYLAWLLDSNIEGIVNLHSHTGWKHGEIVENINWDFDSWNGDPHFKGNRVFYAQALEKEKLNTGKPTVDYKGEINKLYETRALPILILMRNPYNWVHSYVVKHKEDNGNSSIEAAIKLWNNINRSYIEHSYFPKHIIKYENLRDNTLIELKKISEFLNVELRENFVNSDRDAIRLLHHKAKINKISNPLTDKECIALLSKNKKISSENVSDVFTTYLDKEILNFYNNL